MQNLKNNKSFIYYLTLILLVLYPFDQLFTSYIGVEDAISPFKVAFLIYPAMILRPKFIISTLKNSLINLLLLAIVILSLISIIWSVSNSFLAIVYTTKLLVLYSFTVIAKQLFKNDEQVLYRIIAFWIIASAIVSILSFQGFFTTGPINENKRMSFEYVGLNSISISIGYSVVLGYASFYSFKKSILQKVITGTSLVICAYFLLKLGTRSVIWGLILIFSIITLKKKTAKQLFVSSIVLLVCLTMLSFLVKHNLYKGDAFTRVANFQKSTFLTNERLILWLKGFDWYSSNLLGTGAGNEHVAYKEIGTLNLEAHNVFVSALIQFGLPGFLLITFVFIVLFKSGFNFRNTNFQSVYMALLLFLFLQVTKGSFLQTRLFWQPIAVLLIIIEIDKNRTLNARLA